MSERRREGSTFTGRAGFHGGDSSIAKSRQKWRARQGSNLRPRLLRNCRFKHFPGLANNKVEAEACGALPEASECSRPLLSVIGIGTSVVIDQVAFECAIDEDGEFASDRRDGLRLADTERQAAVKPAERGLGCGRDSWLPSERSRSHDWQMAASAS